jgi:hypothetical protein
MPKLPFTCPLKLPLRVKEPVAVSPETKHGEFVVNLKFETATEPSALTLKEVPKAKVVELLLLNRVAFQVPLMLAGLLEFEPHPIRAMPNTSRIATEKCFIREDLGF